MRKIGFSGSTAGWEMKVAALPRSGPAMPSCGSSNITNKIYAEGVWLIFRPTSTGTAVGAYAEKCA